MKRFLIVLMLCLGGGSLTPSSAQAGSSPQKVEKATFAGGCFWCMESPFADLKGVVSVTVGYTGGTVPNPTYEQVSAGGTGHAEAVEITYDPKVLSYQAILDAFWRSQNPTDAGGQFADRGDQYRSQIFYHSPEQEKLAEASKEALVKSGRFAKPIVTRITAAGPFYPAEEYHQHYGKKNPASYHLYRYGSGRDSFLKQTWGSAHEEVT